MLWIKNSDIKYDDQLLVKASASLYEGNIYTIIGENGIGKTTLLYYLAMLKIGEGQYIYHNQLISKKQSDDFRYQRIFILLQELNLFDEWTLKDYLDYMSNGIHYMIEFPLTKKMNEFSVGQKQYLLLLGGYLSHKDIYLLDEPTTALDKKVKEKIMKLLNQLKYEHKIIITISHDQDLIDISDVIYKIGDKQLIKVKDEREDIFKDSI